LRKRLKNSNRVRIIGGQYRRSTLEFPDADGLRPTGDRIRETLFNWLAPGLPGSRCLDAFSGSGALGFEASSRGAAEVVMIELHQPAALILEKNKLLLKDEACQIVKGNALDWLAVENTPFHIIFLDPPFNNQLLEPALDIILDRELLHPDGMIYMETPRNQTSGLWTSRQLEPWRSKATGNIQFGLYRKQ
jgi:16S rRNA (guanine966-N2)-methyltransferase